MAKRGRQVVDRGLSRGGRRGRVAGQGLYLCWGHKNLLFFGLIKAHKKRRQMLPSSTIRNEEKRWKEVREVKGVGEGRKG